MALSEAFTGTNGTWGTAWSLTNNSTTLLANTTAGIYQLLVDFNALTGTDAYTVRMYEKVRSADTQRLFLETALPVGAQTTPIWIFPAFQLVNGWDMSIIRTAGTDRTITWSIRKIA